MNLLRFSHEELMKHPGAHVLGGQFDGRKVWIKRAEGGKRHFLHHVQAAIAFITRQPAFSATVRHTDSLAGEAQRLRLFRERGIHVPEVLAAEDNVIVTADIGGDLKAALDRLDGNAPAQATLLQTAAAALADLHSHKLAHGRPYLRDLSWDGKHIGFLDLEEDPAAVMPLADAQARDILIFLSNASRFARSATSLFIYSDDILDGIFSSYCLAADGDLAVLQSLTKLVTFLYPVGALVHRWLWQWAGNDARRAVTAIRFLHKALKDPMVYKRFLIQPFKG